MTAEQFSKAHRIGRVVFATIVGIAVAYYSYQWITNPAPRIERVEQENVVVLSRQMLISKIDVAALQIVDPLSPNRKIGKVYIYREGDEWAVSGFYRRDENDLWHPYLMALSDDLAFIGVKVNDERLLERASGDPTITIL